MLKWIAQTNKKDRIVTTEARLISNSEITTWLTCRRRYYYEYVLNIEPKVFSEPINQGILIHAILEEYYAAKALGLPEEDCRHNADEPISVALDRGDLDIAVLLKTRSLMERYFNYYEEEDKQYEIYAVESKLSKQLDPKFNMVGTVDLIWRDINTDTYYVVDHKSSYNFWTDDQASISGQMPKYVILGKELGINVTTAMVNQIRTREMKSTNGKDYFKRAYVKPNDHRLRDVEQQHRNASKEIIAFREGEDGSEPVPIYNKFYCSNCPYLDLCQATADGTDLTYIVKHNYKTRQGYGY